MKEGREGRREGEIEERRRKGGSQKNPKSINILRDIVNSSSLNKDRAEYHQKERIRARKLLEIIVQ